MDPWIVTESDEIAARVLAALEALEVPCPSTRIVSWSSIGQLAGCIDREGSAIFYAVAEIGGRQLDVVRNLAAMTGGKIVVVAAVDRHEAVLAAIRAGAHDFLNAAGELEEQLTELLARFRAARAHHSTKGRMIAVVPCQAESDASVLAVNVAAAIARKFGNCGLFDFHLRGGELALLMKLAPRHTIHDLITQRDGVDDAMFQQALVEHSSGVRLLAGPPLFASFGSIQPHICQQLLAMAQAANPYVVVNVEDVIHVEQVEALERSDDILLTLRLDVVSVHRAQRHLEHLRRSRIANGKVHMVAMWTGNSAELPIGAVKKVLNVEVIHAIPEDPLAVVMSINTGTPLVLESPQSKPALAIAALADRLTGASDGAASETPRRSSPLMAALLRGK